MPASQAGRRGFDSRLPLHGLNPMTIVLKPEQQQVVGRAIQAGLIRNADEIVEVGVEAIRKRLEANGKQPPHLARDLAELFAGSPFAGLDMEFERDKNPGREVKL